MTKANPSTTAVEAARRAERQAKDEWNRAADRVEDLTARVGFDHWATQSALEMRANAYERLRIAQDALLDALDRV